MILEVVPPDKSKSKKEVDEFVEKIAALAQKGIVQAIDVPHLIEQEKINRANKLRKMGAREFALLLQDQVNVPIILNKVTVFKGLVRQEKWLIEAWKKGIKKFVFVGSPDDNKHPGLSVVQMLGLAKKLNKKGLTKIKAGAITIALRPNEEERVIAKQIAGAQFFLSQIIYEAEKTFEFLKKYNRACKKEKFESKPIILSFAPVASSKDIEFLKNLRVFIPQKTENKILNGDVSQNSIKEIKRIWEKINSSCKKEKIEIPLKFNVCYCREKNLHLVERLASA